MIQYDAESKAYVGFIPALPGTHSCGASLEELRSNLREAIELMLETMAEDGEAMVEDIQVLVEPIELPA